ncbi:WD repeat-containing protein 46 [Hypsibius exemplaris]|uniref:WD repeat-containing protein 46 n=1 Tax=Hypsibius exemplaris TaxID=2072580 RepID=A0A1W0X5N7_HYPEX|nr:WD repeat-containing protein 46 [Hypsibius exemplaris]
MEESTKRQRPPRANGKFPAKQPARYFDAPSFHGKKSAAIGIKKRTISGKTFDGMTDFVPLDEAEPVKEVASSHNNKTSRKRARNQPVDAEEDVLPSLRGEERPPEDPFEGPADIPQAAMRKFNRGKGLDPKGLRTHFHQKLLKQRDQKVQFSRKQAARSEILHTERSGFLEAEDALEDTARITQKALVKSVDLQSQAKHFDLQLREFGPYGFQYTRNGRFLMLFGRAGHIATMDWLTKKLMCEFHTQETVNCGAWLHQETMFATGQKQWVSIYDNRGIELHCIKKMYQVLAMDFLPYHFLLATGSEQGYLSWLDTSVGQMIAQVNTKSGRLSVLKKNPSNAVIHLGHSNGTVSLWSPNVPEPLVKFLSHHTAIRALDIDTSGRYMATAGQDRRVKIWDLRKYQTVQELNVHASPSSIAFSQSGLLAVGMDRQVQVFKDVGDSGGEAKLYMNHFVKSGLRQVGFCPFEDILGCGYSEGFTSLLIPGSGEAHFDAFETNPFQTKRQRQEMEVHSLLEKIPAELIGLDAAQIGQVHEASLQETLEGKARTLFVNVPKVTFTPKYKALGGAAGWTKRKVNVKEEKKREQIKKAVAERKKLIETLADEEGGEDAKGEVKIRPKSVFSRFETKST